MPIIQPIKVLSAVRMPHFYLAQRGRAGLIPVVICSLTPLFPLWGHGVKGLSGRGLWEKVACLEPKRVQNIRRVTAGVALEKDATILPLSYGK